ncbi:hypothetical protein L9F63_000062, partial [Diploptera punctata]
IQNGEAAFNKNNSPHDPPADFVIVARVKKVSFPDEMTRVFKVKIKKEFKMTEKANVVLKSGRLITGSYSSMCGVDLKPEQTYLITGKVLGGKARISICNYIKPWNEISVRQKKGIRRLYTQGCLHCEIRDCPWWRQCPKHTVDNSTCQWETSIRSDSSLPDCQEKHAICMKTSSGSCQWSTDKNYRECVKTRRRLRDEKLRNEP